MECGFQAQQTWLLVRSYFLTISTPSLSCVELSTLLSVISESLFAKSLALLGPDLAACSGVCWGSKLWQVRICSADAIPQLVVWLSVHAHHYKVVSRKQARPLSCHDLYVFEPQRTSWRESALLGPNLLSGVSLILAEAMFEGMRSCKHKVLHHRNRLLSIANRCFSPCSAMLLFWIPCYSISIWFL